MKNLHILIAGKVYKTGFRYFVKQIAERLEITGSVEYSHNHSVLIEATGTDIALNKLIGFCRLGCIGSQVENISLSEKPFPQRHTFEIINENNSVKNNN